MKIAAVNKTNRSISFKYNPMQQRVAKYIKPTTSTAEKRTYYIRDAQGNVMAVYTAKVTNNSGTITWDTFHLTEQHLYGSNRLGLAQTNVKLYPGTYKNPHLADSSNYAIFEGWKRYELTNHLGNVLAVVSDRKIGKSTGTYPGPALWYEADVLSTQQYYPFGMLMPGRQYAVGSYDYRYGFNGKEGDDEVKGDDNQQDYGMRISDPRVGRFLSVDPIAKQYPWYTPYQFAGNMPIKYIDLDGLEPAYNPKDPSNQDGRNPTATINSIFEESGGQKSYEKNFANYMKGTYSGTITTTSGVSNKSGYTSDSKSGADKGNLWVNNTGIFKAEDYQNFDTRDFSNFLLGNMINGTGPENIEFPINGTVSNYMKGAGIVNDAMTAWYSLNKGKSSLVGGKDEFSGNSHMIKAGIDKGVFHPESFIGSATVMITPVNEKEVLVQIFNVTSITSGDPYKGLPWNSTPISVVRDTSKPSSTGSNKYGNISQLYQFTIPVDASKLKK